MFLYIVYFFYISNIIIKSIKSKKHEYKTKFELIREWANERGLYNGGDIKTQTLKLIEEVGELSKAVLKEDEIEFIDAIGDCVVVLTNVAELGSRHFRGNKLDILIETCIDSAYDVISKRTGKMIGGTFVKDIDLPESVKTMREVYSLLNYMYDNQLLYHPGDNAAEIINPTQDGVKRLFTNEQAIHMNDLMNQAWEICDQYGIDLNGLVLSYEAEWI